MAYISFDHTGLKQFVNDNELGEMQAMVNAADDELRNGTGAGADFRDWLHLPSDYDKEEFARLLSGSGVPTLVLAWRLTSSTTPSIKHRRLRTVSIHWYCSLVTP